MATPAEEDHVWVAVSCLESTEEARGVVMQALCTLLPVLAAAGHEGCVVMGAAAGTGRVRPLPRENDIVSSLAAKGKVTAQWGRLRTMPPGDTAGYCRGSGWALLGEMLQVRVWHIFSLCCPTPLFPLHPLHSCILFVPSSELLSCGGS